MTGYPVIGPVRITAGLGLAGPVGTWVFNLTYPGGSQSGRQVYHSCPASLMVGRRASGGGAG